MVEISRGVMDRGNNQIAGCRDILERQIRHGSFLVPPHKIPCRHCAQPTLHFCGRQCKAHRPESRLWCWVVHAVGQVQELMASKSSWRYGGCLEILYLQGAQRSLLSSCKVRAKALLVHHVDVETALRKAGVECRAKQMAGRSLLLRSFARIAACITKVCDFVCSR